ncbi:MAG: redoxin domain-containing protein [Candidatus Aminicenantes bacterium]|nr:redoxin domain-containing protein [Candidatus Aminicenantes bacterium]
MKARYIISFLIIFCFISSGGCKKGVPTSPDIPETPTPPPTSATPQVGDTAPDFTAKDQNNQDVSLYDYFGSVILFNFSADWCGPCNSEAPHLETLYNDYKSRGFQVITLLLSGSPNDWALLHNLSFPVLDDNNETIWDIYGEGYVPLNIIVDRNCVIRYKQAGFDENAIRAIIEQYL